MAHVFCFDCVIHNNKSNSVSNTKQTADKMILFKYICWTVFKKMLYKIALFKISITECITMRVPFTSLLIT